MIGTLAPYVAQCAGNPNGISTSILNVDRGALVFDSVSGVMWRKVSAKGSNTLYVRADGGGRAISEDFEHYATAAQIPILTATGLVRATTANLLALLTTPGGNVLGQVNLGTQTLPPVMAASGINIGMDQTSSEGCELFSNFAGATGKPFLVGIDPAFYFQAEFTITDVSGTDTLICGFRSAEVNNGTLANYDTYAGLGFNTAANPGAIKVITEIDGGGATVTDTTQTLADATRIKVKVLVSAAGVVTYQVAQAGGTLAAPTVTAAATITDGKAILPFFHYLNASDLVDSLFIHSWEAGYQ